MSSRHLIWILVFVLGCGPVTPRPQRPQPDPAPVPPTSGPTTSGPPTTQAMVDKLLELHNAARKQQGVPYLEVHGALNMAAHLSATAQARTKHMSHDAGGTPKERLHDVGYAWTTYGENVAYGYSTPERVTAGWLNSPGHKRNILNSQFTQVGFGQASPAGSQTLYWTAVFARPDSARPVIMMLATDEKTNLPPGLVGPDVD